MQLLICLIVAGLDPLLFQAIENHFRPGVLHAADESLEARELEETVVRDGDAVEDGCLGLCPEL